MQLVHQTQIEPNSCVAACAAMVLRANGREIDQILLHSRLPGGRKGRHLRAVAPTVNGEFIQADPDDPALAAALRVYLSTGAWIIAQVFALEVARWVERRGTPNGPFGAMPSQAGLLHAVIIVGASAGEFEVRDPWFHGADQPFRISEVELLCALQSELVVVKRVS